MITLSNCHFAWCLLGFELLFRFIEDLQRLPLSKDAKFMIRRKPQVFRWYVLVFVYRTEANSTSPSTFTRLHVHAHSWIQDDKIPSITDFYACILIFNWFSQRYSSCYERSPKNRKKEVEGLSNAISHHAAVNQYLFMMTIWPPYSMQPRRYFLLTSSSGHCQVGLKASRIILNQIIISLTKTQLYWKYASLCYLIVRRRHFRFNFELFFRFKCTFINFVLILWICLFIFVKFKNFCCLITSKHF